MYYLWIYHFIVQIIVPLVQHDFIVVRLEFLLDRIDHVAHGVYRFFHLVSIGLKAVGTLGYYLFIFYF